MLLLLLSSLPTLLICCLPPNSSLFCARFFMFFANPVVLSSLFLHLLRHLASSPEHSSSVSSVRFSYPHCFTICLFQHSVFPSPFTPTPFLPTYLSPLCTTNPLSPFLPSYLLLLFSLQYHPLHSMSLRKLPRCLSLIFTSFLAWVSVSSYMSECVGVFSSQLVFVSCCPVK